MFGRRTLLGSGHQAMLPVADSNLNRKSVRNIVCAENPLLSFDFPSSRTPSDELKKVYCYLAARETLTCKLHSLLSLTLRKKKNQFFIREKLSNKLAERTSELTHRNPRHRRQKLKWRKSKNSPKKQRARWCGCHQISFYSCDFQWRLQQQLLSLLYQFLRWRTGVRRAFA